jgi:hypothetical protein
MLDLGEAAQRLASIWRLRQQRFGAGERRALYARLFGLSGGADDVNRALREIALALAEIGRRREDQGISDLTARVATLGAELSRRLSDKATGIAGFAAREIVTQIREALTLLRHPDLSRALGGGPPFTLLSRAAPGLLGRRVDVNRAVTRASSGLELIRWLARQETAAPLRRDPIVSAAESWLTTLGDYA